jgi:peptidoglycan-associated lipoprotein
MKCRVPSMRVGTVVACALVASACATRQPELAPSSEATPAPASGAAAATAPRTDTGSATPAAPPAGSASAAAASSRAAPREMSIYFEFDSSALSDRGRQIVTQHGDYLVSERRPIRIEGNADERGSREYNIALGQRRAETVRQMLVLRGVGGDRVEAVSNGEERPRCTSHSEDCFAENRRADLVYGR